MWARRSVLGGWSDGGKIVVRWVGKLAVLRDVRRDSLQEFGTATAYLLGSSGVSMEDTLVAARCLDPRHPDALPHVQRLR